MKLSREAQLMMMKANILNEWEPRDEADKAERDMAIEQFRQEYPMKFR